MKKNFLTALLIYCAFTSISQNKPGIKNLVFEGAGIRGIAYCGIVQEMETRNMLQTVEKVGGTSSGAIIALTISLGYTGKEIESIIGKMNFKKLNDGKYLFIGGINRMKKYFGWYRGLKFEDWLENVIVNKTGDANITFEDLRKKGFKDLYVTGTSLNKQQLIIFSHETYPKMKVKDAIRVSMSIPLYFEAVYMDKDGNVFRRPKQKEELDVMIDGGVTGNFPIHMFDSSGYADFSTIGFRIDSDDQIRYDREGKKLAPLPIETLGQYMKAFYTMTIENLNRQNLTIEDWQRTVSISDGNLPPKIRKLSSEQINILITNGKQAIKTYLN